MNYFPMNAHCSAHLLTVLLGLHTRLPPGIGTHVAHGPSTKMLVALNLEFNPGLIEAQWMRKLTLT